MADDLKRLRIDQILVPNDRLRKVDDAKALIIGRSIEFGGQIQPIVVRPTPAAARPYTLVDGETRYRGSELNGLTEIDAIVRKMNGAQARMVEIEANLMRDELDKLERALFITEYRRLWEEEHGEIRRGNPSFSNSVNLTELEPSDSKRPNFYAEALDKFSLSEPQIRRARDIANLQPSLIEAIRNTPDADNQSQLLKLAAMEPARQKKIALAYSEKRDLGKALALTDDNAKAKEDHSVQDGLYDRLTATWERADEKTKARFLEHIGASIKKPREKLPSVSEIVGGGA